MQVEAKAEAERCIVHLVHRMRAIESLLDRFDEWELRLGARPVGAREQSALAEVHRLFAECESDAQQLASNYHFCSGALQLNLPSLFEDEKLSAEFRPLGQLIDSVSSHYTALSSRIAGAQARFREGGDYESLRQSLTKLHASFLDMATLYLAAFRSACSKSDSSRASLIQGFYALGQQVASAEGKATATVIIRPVLPSLGECPSHRFVHASDARTIHCHHASLRGANAFYLPDVLEASAAASSPAGGDPVFAEELYQRIQPAMAALRQGGTALVLAVGPPSGGKTHWLLGEASDASRTGVASDAIREMLEMISEDSEDRSVHLRAFEVNPTELVSTGEAEEAEETKKGAKAKGGRGVTKTMSGSEVMTPQRKMASKKSESTLLRGSMEGLRGSVSTSLLLNPKRGSHPTTSSSSSRGGPMTDLLSASSGKRVALLSDLTSRVVSSVESIAPLLSQCVAQRRASCPLVLQVRLQGAKGSAGELLLVEMPHGYSFGAQGDGLPTLFALLRGEKRSATYFQDFLSERLASPSSIVRLLVALPPCLASSEASQEYLNFTQRLFPGTRNPGLVVPSEASPALKPLRKELYQRLHENEQLSFEYKQVVREAAVYKRYVDECQRTRAQSAALKASESERCEAMTADSTRLEQELAQSVLDVETKEALLQEEQQKLRRLREADARAAVSVSLLEARLTYQKTLKAVERDEKRARDLMAKLEELRAGATVASEAPQEAEAPSVELPLTSSPLAV